jgi:hypothetical protein
VHGYSPGESACFVHDHWLHYSQIEGARWPVAVGKWRLAVGDWQVAGIGGFNSERMKQMEPISTDAINLIQIRDHQPNLFYPL